MLRRAPPVLLVGLTLPLAWFAVWIPGLLLRSDRIWQLGRTIQLPLVVTTNLLCAVGAIELARRTRGWTRAGMVLAATTDILGSALIVTLTAVRPWARAGLSESFSTCLQVYAWVVPLLALVATIGFAVAAGRRALAIGIAAIVVEGVSTPIPPLSRYMMEIDIGLEAFWIAMFALLVGRVLLLALLAAAIASRGREPDRDHVRAAQGLRWLAGGSVARAAATIGAVVLARAVHNDHVAPTLIAAVQALAVLVLCAGAWIVARAQLAALSPYLVHLALALAIGAFVGFEQEFQEAYELVWQTGEVMRVTIPWFVDIGALVATAWLVVALAVYARRRRALVPTAQLCGAAFTFAACLALAFHGNELAFGLFGALASLAVLPLFRVAAREVESDPVQTTADVFA